MVCPVLNCPPFMPLFQLTAIQGPDEELIKYIDVANIACRFYAGDLSIMLRRFDGQNTQCQDWRTLTPSRSLRIWPPSHRSRPRRHVRIDLYQVGALKAFLEEEGVLLNYIKPHGELFYRQCDAVIMDAVLRAATVYKAPFYSKGQLKKCCSGSRRRSQTRSWRSWGLRRLPRTTIGRMCGGFPPAF